MTEKFVTLETAKLLKEKGFDEPCSIAINIEDGRQYGTSRTNSELPIKVCSHPTQSAAQKWLRDTKCLHIEIGYMYGDYWLYDILTIPTHDLIGLEDRNSVRYNTYEEALEAGIQEALKLM